MPSQLSPDHGNSSPINSSPFKSNQQNSNIHREPFCLSLRIDKLVFSQGSVLKSLVKRWNQELKGGKSKKNVSESRDFEDMFRNDEDKAVFLLQLYQDTNNKKISQSIAVGQVTTISPTNNLYRYPINITQMLLHPNQQMNSFIYDYSRQQVSELTLIISMQPTSIPYQKTVIGECRIDPNLFMEMYLDEGIGCVKDCKKLVKRVGNETEIDQQVEVLMEVSVARDRVQLEMVKKEAKKGINVMDFKQHIRKILIQKQHLEIEELLNEDQQPQQNAVPQYNEQLYIQSQKPKRSTLQKYMSYLNRHVESQLQYFNPQKQRVEKEVKRLFAERKESIQKARLEAEKMNQKKKQLKGKQEKQTKNKKNNLTTYHKPSSTIGNKNQENIKEILKIVIFIVVSAILLYLSMTPTKKTEIDSVWYEQDEIDLMDPFDSQNYE